MKVVVAWLVAASFAFVLATSCSINHKSDDYVCTSQSDCEQGRQCLGGYCIVPGGVIDARVDAPGDRPRDGSPTPDAPGCPAQCTSCNINEKSCLIDCQQTDCSNDQIVCPAGYKCDIRCSTPGACDEGIDCSSSASCAVTCSGVASCQNVNCAGGVDCTLACTGPDSCRGMLCIGGDCDVTCMGEDSCRAIDCDGACACDVRCGPASDCSQLSCRPNTTTTFMCRGPQGRGCSSNNFGCNTCM